MINLIKKKIMKWFRIFAPLKIQQKNMSTISFPKMGYLRKKIKKKLNKKAFIEKHKEILDSFLLSNLSFFINKQQISYLNPFFAEQKNTNILYSFVINPKVAKDIAEKLIPYLKIKNCFVVENNAGLGLISLYLIQFGLPKIYIFESEAVGLFSSLTLEKKYEEKIKILTYNLKENWFEQLNYKINSIMSCETSLKIIGVIPNYRFFSHFIYFFISRKLWNSPLFTEFFAVISLNLHNKILKFEEYKGKFLVYCLFNLIFDCEIISEYPREAFLPPSNVPNDKMFLVKIIRKQNCFDLISEDNIAAYIIFLRILGKNPFGFVLSSLEKWLPGCGPLLISKGISLTLQTRDLTFSESITLFNIIKNSDKYENFQYLVTALFETEI